MYAFELQPLLDARQAQEEQKQRELAEALRYCESQQAILEGIRNSRMQMIAEYRALEGQTVSSLQLMLYSENIAQYREKEDAQRECCRQAEVDAEEKRLSLIEATKQKKILEKLKEKRLLAYQQELSRKENKELDETAILRFGGNSL